MNIRFRPFALVMCILTTFLEYQVAINFFNTESMNSILLVVLVGFISFQIAFIVLTSRTEIPLLTTLFVTFNYIFLFLAPQAVLSTKSYWFVNNLTSQSNKVDAFILLSIVVMLSNVTIVVLSFREFRIKIFQDPIVGRILPHRLVILIFFYIASMLVILFFSPGVIVNLLPKGITSTFPRENDLTLAQFGLGRALVQTTPVVIAICCLRLATRHSEPLYRILGYFFAALSLILSLPLQSSRQMFLFSFTPLFLALFHLKFNVKRILVCTIPLIVIFAQPLTFAITHSFQDVQNYGLNRVLEGVSFNVNDLLVQGDFDSFGMIALGIKSLESGLYFFPGQQLFAVLFFWVPRSIWEGKPFDTAIEIARFNNLHFQNLSAPWILELLVNGGLLLVSLGAVLLPIVLRKLDSRAGLSDKDWMRNLLLSGSIFILLRGSLLQAFGVVAYGFLLLAFVTKGAHSPRSHSSQIPIK